MLRVTISVDGSDVDHDLGDNAPAFGRNRSLLTIPA